MAPPSITSSDPEAQILLLIPVTLCSASLEVFVPVGGGLQEQMMPLKWTLKDATHTLQLLMPLSQFVKKEAIMLAVMALTFRRIIWSPLHTGGKEEYF